MRATTRAAAAVVALAVVLHLITCSRETSAQSEAHRAKPTNNATQ